ncbi:MAG: peptide-methionine (S)-S-oxide reductase MsrA [Dehalococcoidia bacterium]|nr:peptide-methionine (S)-S-oxide reductase MsrA [Dehalococcoidia bacterium]
MQTATLAGGCFWCVEAVFDMVEGVHKVVSGYTGGRTDNPNYREICTGSTGHAEAVQVQYDPKVLSYETVLELFFAYHDPTTLNRQGADTGTQYRSAIYFHDEEQERIARETVRRLEDAKIWPSPIVTEIAPLERFYDAEGYHQSFYRNNPEQMYCQFVIDPKVKKLREKHSGLLKVADR